jgi:tetratricopeptide (TPR) repeat protein
MHRKFTICKYRHIGRTPTRVFICAVLVAATMTLVATARTEASEEPRLCWGSTDVSHEQRLAGCTAVIKAGHESAQNLAKAFNNRGNAYLGLRDYERAIADYGRAIEIDPQHAPAFYGRGNAYQRKGRYDRAIKDYDRAIEIVPSNAAAFFGRGRAYQDKARYDFDAYLNEGQYETLAIRDYDKAIRLNPKNAAAFNNRGNAYVSKRMYDRALQDYDEAIRLKPDSALYFKNRGDAFRKIGQYQSAIADYRKTLSLKIDDPTKKQIERAFTELGLTD